MIIDRIHRKPRIWSNFELKKIANLFSGKIINVSGWKDSDKQGNFYKNYFINASDYVISNFSTENYGFQGDLDSEIFLDLEKAVSPDLVSKFDVVFNHTVLEHIFDVRKAFQNLCQLSKDVVIVIVPFMQQQHTEYGDFWRFTPLALDRLFKENNMTMIYCNFNDEHNASIYIFAVATKYPTKWCSISKISGNKLTLINERPDYYIGTRIIRNNILFRIQNHFLEIINKIRR